MTLQVLPPELLETKDKIETKEPQPYFKPSSLKDGESEEFRLLGCYETGHAVTGWQYASETAGPDGELKFSGYVVTRTHPGVPPDLARETDWSKPDRPKIDGTFVKPRRFLAWTAMSAARGRLEVLFIEQKSLREQLTEVLQEIEDYTWTEDGLANFGSRLLVRAGLKLHTASFRRYEKCLQRSWNNGRPNVNRFGYPTSLRERILSTVNKLTKKVYLLVE